MDEDHLPFKSMSALLYKSHLRLHVEAESLHCMWNCVKLSAKRAGLQGSLLLGTIMANCAHGPCNSGSNQLSRERAAHYLAEHMTIQEFQELQESMRADTAGVRGIEIPRSAADLPGLQVVNALGPYARSSAG